jgi:hypothetical protein
VFRSPPFWCTLPVSRVFVSSALGSAQPSSNYAFKRTAGPVHCVSCCSVGPRPLNAPLGSGSACLLCSPFAQGTPRALFEGLHIALVVCLRHVAVGWLRLPRASVGCRRLAACRNRLVRANLLVGARPLGRTASVLPQALGGRSVAGGHPRRSVRGVFDAQSVARLGWVRAHGAPRSLRSSFPPSLTMRSSGLRGESMVFPDVLSARSRLTRR